MRRCAPLVASYATESFSKAQRRKRQIDALRASTAPEVPSWRPPDSTSEVPVPCPPAEAVAESLNSRAVRAARTGPAINSAESLKGHRSIAAHLLAATAPLRGDESGMTPALRAVHDAIAQAGTKEEAVSQFQEGITAAGVAPTGATFQLLITSLLSHHVAAQMGTWRGALDEAVREAAGTTDDRWAVSVEERAQYVAYWCRTHERWAVKGSSFNTSLGMNQEGADNAAVAMLEFQMRKHGAAVPMGALVDLMHLDISWTAALRLYDYCAVAHRVRPPVDMCDRLTGLMTGYKTDVGSRPWQRALSIYGRLRSSGYEPTLTSHTHALDSLWRSADGTLRPQHGVSAHHTQWVWERALEVCDAVSSAATVHVGGDEGCAYAESLIKLVSATGRWAAAVSLLAGLDVLPEEVSYRMLTPTAETLAFVIAACNAAGHVAHSATLLKLFRMTYRLRDLHPEVLKKLLHSMRFVVRTAPDVGGIVEELMRESMFLDREVAVACLQLLSSRFVATPQQPSKWLLAAQLLHSYDASLWPQQPLVRQTELQTVFRACRVIAASALDGPSSSPADTSEHPLLRELASYIGRVFGYGSSEMEWLAASELHTLSAGQDWQHALQVYERVVHRVHDGHGAALPMPLRQAKHLLLSALVRLGGAAGAVDDDLFEFGTDITADEATVEAERADCERLVEQLERTARRVFTADDVVPHAELAKLLLRRSATAQRIPEQKRFGVAAMEALGLADVREVRESALRAVSDALGLTELHVESAVVRKHAALRHTALRSLEAPGKLPRAGPLNAVYR